MSTSPYPSLATTRLRLEPCDASHLDGLSAINSDPLVMRYLTGSAETREQTLAMIERVQARWARWGYSWWTLIERDSSEIVGIGCIQNLRHGGEDPDPTCPFEIGWRLRRDQWGRGLAIESAVEMAAFAFDRLSAPTLYAVCDPANDASTAVMKRLGMRYRGMEDWYQRPLATYEITAHQWRIRSTDRATDGGRA
jgi:RimJ/RimL family protein N-acetyltransferase